VTVTVLLTSYEAAGYLQQAISSVLGQTFEDFELLIMDDGSRDPAVAEILDGVEDPRATVVRYTPTVAERRESCRYATLINLGAEQTTGEHITYLCGDDYYLPDRLERMVAKLAEGHDVVYGPQLMLDAAGVFTGERAALGVLDDAHCKVDLNSVMHTRESFERVKGWPDGAGVWRVADAWMWTRLTNFGYLFIPVDGGPTDAKHYRPESVDARCAAGQEPWQ
jgi:glycosyltransferase involved in cell wall biosynthesis